MRKGISIRPPICEASFALATLSDTYVELYSYTDSDVRPYQASKCDIVRLLSSCTKRKDAELAFVAHAGGCAALAPPYYRCTHYRSSSFFVLSFGHVARWVLSHVGS